LLNKKIIISGKIKTVTGLHIGSPKETAEIGGIDSPVIKDSVSGLPYIPGSSLKGKMRCLLEKSEKPADKSDEEWFNRKVGNSKIHVCNDRESASSCPICRLFGSTGHDHGTNHPSRVILRDSFLINGWKEKFRKEPLLEAKTEASIDRVSSAATPRTIERVPPDVEFNFEIVYNDESNGATEDIKNLFRCMKMLEDDYLGGSGSRGYGKIKFLIDSISERDTEYYTGKKGEKIILDEEKGVEELIETIDKLW